MVPLTAVGWEIQMVLKLGKEMADKWVLWKG